MQTTIPINTERTFLYSADIHVCVVATISMQVHKNNVENAVDAIVRRHPLLTATIDINKNNQAFYVLNTSKPIVIEFLDVDSEISWQEWVETKNNNPFDFKNGPLLKIMAQTSGRKSTFAFLGHHMLGDGLSYYYLVRDFLTALDHTLPSDIVSPCIIKGATSFPKYAGLGLLPSLFFCKLNQSYKKDGKVYDYQDFVNLYHLNRERRKPALQVHRFTQQETQKMITLCRQHNVTVNEAITTAFIYARHKANNPCDYVGISCDVRNELLENPKESMGNFVAGIAFDGKYNCEKGFWGNAKEIQQIINSKLKNKKKRMQALAVLDAASDSLIESASFVNTEENPNKATKLLSEKLCGIPHDRGLGISNLGRHSLCYKSFSVTDFVFVPPLFGQSDCIVGVITVNGEMLYSLRYIGAETNTL